MTKELKEGIKAPSFCLKDKDGNKIKPLSEYKDKWIILYFYPKDNTSGCTKEAEDFTKNLKKFEKLNTLIFGISPDSQESHKKFIEKKKLKVILLSDEKKKVLEKYGVWQLKKMYGREYYGVVRTTFLIDTKGKIRYIWKKVKVKGHVEEVLEKLKEIQKEQ